MAPRILRVVVPQTLIDDSGSDYDLGFLQAGGRERFLLPGRDGLWLSAPYVDGDSLAKEAVSFIYTVKGMVGSDATPKVIEVTNHFGFVETDAPDALDFASALTVATTPAGRRVVGVRRRLVERQIRLYIERGHCVSRVLPSKT